MEIGNWKLKILFCFCTRFPPAREWQIFFTLYLVLATPPKTNYLYVQILPQKPKRNKFRDKLKGIVFFQKNML